MRKNWKRWIAGLLTAVMLVTMLPTVAYAAVGDLLDMSGVQRTALLAALEEVYGDDAEAYLAILKQYGLIDEDGNIVTDEKIIMDGQAYTLDEIEAILDDPATDLTKVVEVDGDYLTLADLKTVVEIERYLAYLKATYFTEQDLTDEQIDNFYDLAEAWANGDMVMLAADALEGVGPAGVDHDVRLTVTGAATAEENGEYTVTVEASRSAADQEITFSWRTVDGSVTADIDGEETVTMYPGESKTLTVHVGETPERVQGTGTFLVQLYDLKNALLSDGSTRWEQTVTVDSDDYFKYYSRVSKTLSYERREHGVETDWVVAGGDEEMRDRIRDGGNPMFLADKETLSLEGMSSGNYLRIFESGGGSLIAGNFQYTVGALGWFFDPGSSRPIAEERPFSYELKIDDEVRQADDNFTDWVVEETYLLPSIGLEAFPTQSENLDYEEGDEIPEHTMEMNMSGYYRRYQTSSGSETSFAFDPYLEYRASYYMQETTKETTVSFSAPAGTYYAGQQVPIVATFDYPVKITEDMTITVNDDQTLTPEEVETTGESCTFLYPVTETSGGAISVTAANFVGDEPTCQLEGANKLELTISRGTDDLTGVTLESLDRELAFGAPTLAVRQEQQGQKPVLTITLPLTGKPYDNWVLNEVTDLTTGILPALKAVLSQTGDTQYDFRVNDPQNPTALVAEITLPYNTSVEEFTGQVDFLLDGYVMIGWGREYTLDGSKPVGAFDGGIKLTRTNSKTGEREEQTSGTVYFDLAEMADWEMTLSFTLKEGDFTWGDVTKVTAYPEDNKPEGIDNQFHFAWEYSGPVTVVLNEDGSTSFMLTGETGYANARLVALNGDMEDALLGSVTLHCENWGGGTGNAFLQIPESGRNISVREGNDARIYWSSNICALNQNAGEDGAFVPTTFTVQLGTLNLEDADPTVAVVKEWTVTTDEKNPILSAFTIPWDEGLDTFYNEERTGLIVACISAEYQEKRLGTYINENGVPEMGEGEEPAIAYITLLSPPASVKLDQPAGGLYQTDGGGNGKDITLSWTADNLDVKNGGGQFELYIAGGEKTISETDLTGGVTQDGNTYSYTLNVPAVTPETGDPASYRDAYTVTVKVQNAADAAWAYDSYVLYVYSEDILEILLDHDENTGGSYTMSNVEKIKTLWGDGGENGSNAIVALQRDIALRNVISINYGQYAWAELADQIAWASNDSSVASVNYRQGTLYENIENFSYTTYRPSTDFVLSGLKDGETTVTATHGKLPEISDSLTVDVETLRDQLYLFQCYPKTETTLTYQVYTSAAKTATEEYTLTTNDKGEAAIYAPHGIAGDIYCNSVADDGDDEDVIFLGVIRSQSLVSSEADSTKLQLYPVNTLQLRRAAQAEIYLKNSDGTPYEGQVTFRGGVYRGGEYCTGDRNSAVQFGLQGEKDPSQWKPGNTPQTVSTNDEGRLLVNMDLGKFKTADNQKEVQAGEALYYLFQLEYGDGTGAEYYPIMLRVDANLNLDDVAISGDSIVAWEKNESGQKQPYIAQQTLSYSPKKYASVADIRGNTGNVGPSDTFPTAYVTTSIMWWGDEHAKDLGRANTVMLQDATGKTPECQTSETTTYPFTDLAFTENRMTMDKDSMEEWGMAAGESRGMRAVLSEDGTTASRTISLPFQMVNMIGVPEAEASNALTGALADVKSGMTVDASGDVGDMGDGDIMIEGGMDLLSDDAGYDPEKDKFAVRLYATSDPTVFRALFGVNMGDLEPGVYPEYDDPDNMTFVHGDASTGKNQELEALPGPMDVYSMVKGKYLSAAKEEAQQAAAGKGLMGTSMALGGYMEANISYNSSSGKWECQPISGGFNVGAGLNFNWNFNAVVGIVPITASVNLGGALEVRMDMQQGNYYEVTSGMDGLKNAGDQSAFNTALASASYTDATGSDYLTNLRMYFYIRAFAGVGFDVSVVAFKIGVFGQLNLDMQYKWLNRGYLEESSNISAVGPVSSRTDDVIQGSNLSVSGSTGIEFVFKFLFISYEKIFCSIGFESESDDPGWRTIEEIWKANKTINGKPVTRMAMPNGQVIYAVDLGAQLERRDYVDTAEQEWLGGRPSIGLFSLDKDQNATLAETLQIGAYSYANPVLSDDGEVMFYLSDREDNDPESALDIRNTRVAVSTKSNGQFQQGERFDSNDEVSTGYGDSNVKVAGSDGSYAAVWVRQTEDITENVVPGTALDDGQQMLQINSTEIMAATSTGGSDWTLEQLTDNSTPDLAPVVAASGNRIIVAWREVKSSDASNLTNFDQQDAIRYAVCENGQWIRDEDVFGNEYVAAQTLYDGTGSTASVKGLEMAMLEDGTAAVVYTLDTNSTTENTTDWETVVAIIPAVDGTYGADDTQSEDLVRTFRLTSDNNLDENPQITTAEFGDGEERFVVAWHTERAITDDPNGETESDIRLSVMDTDGKLYENMPESLSVAAGGAGDTIGSNFRFAKNTQDIGDLAILWVDSVSGETDETTYDSLAGAVSASSTNVGHDVLKAVKFVEDGDSYTLSGTVEVAEMQEGTLIDHFDAYVNDTSTYEIRSVILGTNYSETTEREVTISDGENDETATITVANPVSGMYTATEKFTNQIQESAVMLAYEELYTNSDIDVQFTIRNTGMDAITKLEIISENESVYTSDSIPLNLLPNRDITVTAKFPTGEAIENANYTIKATFKNGVTVELPGTLYLDIPDVGISKVETVKQADGVRTLRYALHNRLAASLADEKDNWQVKVGFYADQSCTTILKGTDGQDLIDTITETADLSLIDAGGYSAEVTLPVAEYMKEESGAQAEIPSTGIPVYVKAWIEAPVEDQAMRARTGSYNSVSEYFTANNTTSLTLRSLAEERDEPVTVIYDMSVANGKTIVNTKVQYNYLGGTTSGNLIVTLLDAQGQPIAKQQSYTKADGLLTLEKEGAATQTFEFAGITGAAGVRVEFSDLILTDSSVELDHISIGGHTAVFDSSTNTYTVDAVGLTNSILEIAPKDPQNATIKLDGQDYDVDASHATQLASGTTTWNITVSNGGNSASYTLKLTNNADFVSVTGVSLNKTSLTLTEGSTSQLTATVEPNNATNRNVTWSSSNSKVATVDGNGKVTAHKAGTATITVTTADGDKTAECKVTVEAGGAPAVKVDSVSLNQTSMNLTAGSTGQLKATISPSNATNQNVTWSSGNTSVATVDASGNVKAIQAGTTTITVTTEDGNKTATCAVTVTAAPINPDHGGSGSGSSGLPSYVVDTAADIDHGTITVKPSRAEKGDTVTITAKPDKGYQVDKVTVTDKNGDTVKVTDRGDGKYTFTMPNSKVSVDVTFVPEKQWTNPFVDVAEDAWYYDAVRYVNENSLMAGTSASTFEPDLTTTRGMIVTILYRLEGSPNIENEIWGYPFKDVDVNAYYATAVYWARMNGIVAGYSDELFGPNDTITREQMAAILYRYAQYKGCDTTAKADLSKFADAAQVGSYAVEAIRWANAEGLVSGTSDTTLTPGGSSTRAQAAVILTRFCQNIVK